MKICGTCKIEKPFTDFYKNSHHSDGIQSYCKNCNRLWVRNRYRKNKTYYDSKNKDVRERNRKFILEYLKTKECIDCGEKDPIVLEFDHKEHKNNNVSSMVSRLNSIKTIIKEIEICVVRCANCHRRKTAKQRGYYRFIG